MSADNTAVSAGAGSKNRILREKVAKSLSLRTDTAQMADALAALESSLTMQQQPQQQPQQQYSNRTIDSKSVRSAIEKDALLQAKEFEDQLRTLVAEAVQLRERVDCVRQSTHQLNFGIDDTEYMGIDQSEKQVVENLNKALKQHYEAKSRVAIVTEFLVRFDLCPDDAKLLESFEFDSDLHNIFENSTSRHFKNRLKIDENRVEQFLDALDRVHSVRVELSRVFKSGEPGVGTTSAIRMMETLGSRQEKAYEKLYKWLQSFLGFDSVTQNQLGTNVNDEGPNEQMDEILSYPCLQRALRTLKHTPSFYRHTIELITSMRRAEVTRRFLLALTIGYDDSPPIEMKAHDPRNYVGDMLAFSHQSLNMEKEIIRGLIVDEDYEAGEAINDDISFLKPLSALDMLSHSMGGVARPLKARISQVLSSLSRRNNEGEPSDDGEEILLRKNISEVYSICGLLSFYHSATIKVMQKLARNIEEIDDEIQLLAALIESLEDAANTYSALIKVYGASLDSLTDKDQVKLVASLLSLVSEVRSVSPGFDSEIILPNKITDALSLDSLCKMVVEPSIKTCKSFEEIEQLRLSLNNALDSGLSDETLLHVTNAIETQEKVIITEIISIESQKFLDECGLGSVYVSFYNRIHHLEGQMSSCPGLDYDTLQRSFKIFYSSLYAPPIPSFAQISDQEKRRYARLQSITRVSEFYKVIYDEITSNNAGYGDVSFLAHNPDQVNILLSL